MINSLDISAFENGKKFISLGKIRPEIVSFLIEKEPSLSGQLNSETEILFWKDRLRHTELHKDDFFSDNEFYNCLERIPFIISNPDYISVHKKDNSISFIKDFSAHVSVAIRISSSEHPGSQDHCQCAKSSPSEVPGNGTNLKILDIKIIYCIIKLLNE
jgi:hypothetical protein